MNKRNTAKEKKKERKKFPYKSRVVEQLKKEIRIAELVSKVKNEK